MASHIATSMNPKANINNNSGSNGYGSESSSGTNSNSPSPPPSPLQPRLSPTLSQCRRRLSSKNHSFIRRKNPGSGLNFGPNLRYLLVLPLLYVSGLVMCVGQFSGLLGYASVPGSVYRSHENFQRLWDDIRFDNSSALQLSSVWKYKRRMKIQKPCPNSTARNHFFMYRTSITESPGSSGYLIVDANGGLNQQRSAICNAVAVAGLLNAILVIPQFELNSVWRDPSQFGDIYDVDYFIDNLKGYVNVVRELPKTLMERYDRNISNIPNLRVQAWAPVNYYLGVVHPILRDQGVIRIAPFDNRLTMNVPPHIQLLRCIANYKALKFSLPISTLAEKLVNRMIERSSTIGGKYVSVHLRFEQDMVAFSCCAYDGGEAENLEMDSFREKGWKGKFKRKDHVIAPALNRVEGKCPLTPVEGYSSRLSALDYTVSLFSEVFVTTQDGNFPHFLMGHRRFLFGGHAKTIKPDKRKLVVLLQDMGISWKAFKEEMEVMLAESDRKGMMVPRVKKFNRKTSIYTYPLPECACLQHSNNSTLKLTDSADVLESYYESMR
ncbi:uncharacterized protein At1g04910-like isoform X1 [Durio zibethinus]|uniref:O-fucosyltransferase family protein n=1 Tax=Durio zibethinus TaxID=66656 RepID=A0A6P5Z6A2_DURZI|nr:uncharacterized protein At1g04910-like isoform X1 [Durio zibethinus]